MSENQNKPVKSDLVELHENPYDPGKQKPEDIMRIFFLHNVPIIPVITKSGSLAGVLKKDDMVSELSDIERVRRQKTEQFISKLIRKVTLDDILPYVTKNKTFVVIDIFGERQGEWSRLELLEASEKDGRRRTSDSEIERQREEQTLEWIIYLILEHIPRPLYAINQHGKTIFYNSHFEDFFSQAGAEIDIEAIEKSFTNPEKNDFIYSGDRDDMLFYNKELDIHYEKVPLINKSDKIGFLIFCDRPESTQSEPRQSRKAMSGKPLSDQLAFAERMIIVETLRSNSDSIDASCKQLKLSKQIFLKKIKTHGIEITTPLREKKNE
jgi:transcriptional regulator with PAS, ATPase and Fis domain